MVSCNSSKRKKLIGCVLLLYNFLQIHVCLRAEKAIKIILKMFNLIIVQQHLLLSIFLAILSNVLSAFDHAVKTALTINLQSIPNS